MTRPLFAPNRYPFADAFEVFEGDAASGALGFADEMLADAVVLDLAEAGLLARDLSEVTFGRLGVGALKAVTQAGVALANLLDGCARMMIAIGISGQVADTEVDAEPAFWVDGGTFGHIDGDVEVELALAGNEVGLATSAVELAAMVGADDRWHDDAAIERSKGHSVQAVLEGVEALVVGHGAFESEGGLLGLVPLVRLADLGDATNGELGAEAELAAKLHVVELLELELVGRLQGESVLGQPVTSLVETAHEVQQGRLLRRIDKEFAGGDKFQHHRITASMDDCQGHFLPAVNDGASVASSSTERNQR